MAERRMPALPGEPAAADATVSFTFDGHRTTARADDTVGSALAASGVDVIARSFKYHRPRGLLCCTGRCPNCMVDVDGQPNVRSCVTPVVEGMKVRSQNARPSLRWDVMALTDRVDRLLPVGFYYKTFIRPRKLWPLYERVLRGAAGLGKVDPKGHPDLHVRRRNVFADVAVVGGGPSGCLAALEAASAGARVVLIDDQSELGGHLRVRVRPVAGDRRIDGLAGREAARRLRELVAAEPRIEHLARATAVGLYEGRLLGVSQGDTFVHVRAEQVVVASGAAERPLIFENNDRPGIMLASGILRLAWLHRVRAGERCVVVADDDHGLRQALELVRAGIAVTTLIDLRSRAAGSRDRAGEAAAPGAPAAPAAPAASAAASTVAGASPSGTAGPSLAAELRAAGIELIAGATVLFATGRGHVTGLRIRLADGSKRLIKADLVALAARPEPVISILAQEGSTPRWDPELGDFVTGPLPDWLRAAGHVNGPLPDGPALTQGALAGRAAAAAAVSAAVTSAGAPAATATSATDLSAATAELDAAIAAATAGLPDPPTLSVPGGRKQFVCVCEDVTVKELQQGVNEGFDRLETLKRYSTVTMGPCQGKMCHGLAARVHARIAGTSPAETGLTTARPPFQPVTLAALAGPHQSRVRRTAMHERHAQLGATWTDMGDWKRPLHYGDLAGEIQAVHQAAGVIDVSTLGTLDVQGPDAGAFLDWLHPNRFSDLKVGRVRYRAMLDDAGIILDDGAVARLGPERFFLSTTTGNLDAVDQWLRWWLASGGRSVEVTDVTGQYAAINLAGPRSRDVMARLTALDVSRDAMPYLAAVEGLVAGIPAIILRIGFVGELGYEIHVPADYGVALWDAVLAAGSDLGLRPFGVDAQRVLRLEKQHAIVGQDTDALSNTVEAGMGWLIKADKPDFIGRDASLAVLARGPNQVLTGFEIEGDSTLVPAEGASILRDGVAVGRVTSCKWSPTLGRTIGLAWVAAADAVEDRELQVRMGTGTLGVTVPGRVRTRPFYDPDGERLRM